MWILYLSAITTVSGFLIYIFLRRKNTNIKNVYAKLIELFQHIDKNIRLENESSDSLTFEISNHRGSLLLILTQYNGILCIEIERINSENIIDNQEWYFLENQNQNWMFHKIISDIIATKSGVLKETTLQRLLKLSIEFLSDHKQELEIQEKSAQSLFCMAYEGVKNYPRYKYINSEGRFEMLLFNCVFLLNKFPEGFKQQEITKEIIALLLFYLEQHHSINHIDEIESFLDSRFELYSSQLEKIKSTHEFEYHELYYLFIIKPLSTKEKHKNIEIENFNFRNSILNMISNLEQVFQNQQENGLTSINDVTI